MEVTPGAFISHNNDDDNDEGTADNDETGTVTGEDNLVKITLSVSPALGNCDGKVRLSVPYNQKHLRIWQNPDKGNLILQADNEVYYKDWPPPDVPQNLYVEGYLSGISTSTLWLSHIMDGSTIHDDTVKFRCVDLKVFSDASIPLDDWPKTATEIRSPKYIFGKEDPIYVEATNLGMNPALAETRNNLVKVTSESGGVARLTLKETDLESWYFNNIAALGELLYLSDADSEADGDTIKVVDEEKLTFWLEIQPGSENYVSCYRVMVDRGEFLIIGGSDPESSTLVDIFNLAIDMQKQILTTGLEVNGAFGPGYNWWENGYIGGNYYTNPELQPTEIAYEQSKEDAFNYGSVSPASCADIISFSGHGGGMGTLNIAGATIPEIVWSPGTGTGWSGDTEIVILHGCDTIAWKASQGIPAAPEGEIEDVWIGNVATGVDGDELFSTGIHAVLGYCDLVTALFFYDDVVGFWSRCQGGSNVADAWKQACLSGVNQSYAVVVRESNLNDRFALFPSRYQYITRDSTALADSTTFIYYWYNGNEKTYGPPAIGGPQSAATRYRLLKYQVDKQVSFIGSKAVDYFAVSLDENPLCFDIARQAGGEFNFTSVTNSSFSASNNFDRQDSDRHSVEVDVANLKSCIGAVGLVIPYDYVLTSKRPMMARRFGNGRDSGEMWSEADVFTFVRRIDGKTIFSDTCLVAIRNDDVLLYDIKNHLLQKKSGSQTVKNFAFNAQPGSVDQSELTSELVYEIKRNKVIPLWHVAYQNYVFKYDAITGETYRDD